jgi:hypothetical protein
MAAQTVSNVYIRSFRDGVQYVPSSGEWAIADGGGVYHLGYNYGGSTNKNDVIELKFTLESEAEILQLSLKSYTNVGANRRFNYIILPAEDGNYNNATYDMASDGVVCMNKASYSVSTLLIAKKLTSGTYYMYLWTSMPTETQCWIQLQGSIAMQYGLPSDFDLSIAAKNIRNGSTYADWYLLDNSGFNILTGNNGAGDNYVTVFRFVLPQTVSSIDFSACLYKEGTWENSELKYKIVSTAEDESLNNAGFDMDADGIYTLTTFTDWQRVEFTVAKVVPAGITYLYLWTNKEAGTRNTIGLRLYGSDTTPYETSITYEEVNGAIYIDNGIEFEMYQIYIDNGTGWDLYIPYIDNGTSWDLYS